MRAAAPVSLRGQRLLVFGEVHGLPRTLDNPCANLRGGLSLAQLLVSVEILTHANVASGTVFAGEAIEQAAVSQASIAVAVARLLVERFLDSSSNRVGILHAGLGEELRMHGRGKRARGNLIMIRRQRFIAPGLRHAHLFWRTGGRV